MRSSDAARRFRESARRIDSELCRTRTLIAVILLCLAAVPLLGQSSDGGRSEGARDRESAGRQESAQDRESAEERESARSDQGAQLDILVLPMRVSEEEARLAAVAGTVEETISLAFRLLPGYTVARVENLAAGVDPAGDDPAAGADARPADAAPDAAQDDAPDAAPDAAGAEDGERGEDAVDTADLEAAAEGRLEALRRVARAYGVEVVIYGEARRGDGGELSVSLNAYDYFDDVVAIRQREATTSVFDVFDMADDIALAFMEAFEEVPLAFGTLRLAPEGARGDYTVFINNQEIGTSVRTVERLLTGRYSLRVEMERPRETLTLVERRIAIGEGDRPSVGFEIPPITEEERARIAEFREGAWERYHRGLTSRTVSRIEDAVRIAEALPESGFRETLLGELRRELEDLAGRVAAAEETVALLAGMRPRPDGTPVPAPAGAYVGRMSDYLDGDAWISSYTPYVASGSIRVDGSDDDWAFFPSIPGSGSHWGRPPVEMEGVAAARDDDYLYLVARPSGALPRNLGYQFQVMDIQDRRGRNIGSTVVGIEPEEGRIREYFAKNYWDHGPWNELSGASIALGRVVEARIPISLIDKETPRVNMHIYRPDWSRNGGTHDVMVNISEHTGVHPAERELSAVREAAGRTADTGRGTGAGRGAASARSAGAAAASADAVGGSEFFLGDRFEPGWSFTLLGGGTLGTEPPSWNILAGLSRDVTSWLALGVAGGINVTSREWDNTTWTDGLAFGSLTLGRLHRGLAFHLLTGAVITDEQINLGIAPGFLIRRLYLSVVPMVLFEGQGVIVEVGYSWSL